MEELQRCGVNAIMGRDGMMGDGMMGVLMMVDGMPHLVSEHYQ